MLVQPKIKQQTLVKRPCSLQLKMATSTSSRFLVDVGAAKDQADNSGATPLLLAAENGNVDMVRFLVDVGAAKDQANIAGETTLVACS